MKSAFLFGGTPDLLALVQPSALVDYQFRKQGTLVNNGTLGGTLTYTRSGNGTYINASGLLATAGANVARFDFDPLSLTRKGLLFEGQGTNYNRNSEDFVTNWSLLAGGTVPTRSTYTGVLPDGSTGTVYRLAFAAVSGTTALSFIGATAQITHASVNIAAPSLWIKSVSGGSVGLHVQSTTNAPQAGAYAVELITPTSEWRRYSYAKALAAGARGGNAALSIGHDCRATPGTIAAATVDIWGAQYEEGQVTSYIPSTGATATRFADAASMTGLPSANVTLIEKPAGCATLSAGTLTLNTGYTIDRIMVLPSTYSADQIATIRASM